MHRHERYEQGTGVLIKRVEIERQSPSLVRYRRYDSQGNLVEDRPATEAEEASADSEDRQEAKEKARRDFLAGVNALPGANPMKDVLQDLIRWRGWG